jgi:hypothetical protein
MLARADSTDFTLTNLTLVFSSLLVIGVASFLGFLIYRAARLHRRAQAEGFAAVAILWVVVSAGAVIHDLSVQSKWSHEAAERLRSGYYTPAEVEADAPRHPTPLFIALAAIYPLLLILASRPIRYPAPADAGSTSSDAPPDPTANSSSSTR